MKTDHPIYLFLSAGAEAFRVLTDGCELVGPYRFCSLTIKGLERRLDGIFEPDGHDGPVYVIEFQGQHSDQGLVQSADQDSDSTGRSIRIGM